jgi:hypothetical protein
MIKIDRELAAKIDRMKERWPFPNTELSKNSICLARTTLAVDPIDRYSGHS